MTNPYLFTVTVLTVLATPGPTNALLASAAALGRIRASFMLPLAELAGYLVTVCLVGFLLRTPLALYPQIAVALKLVVAAFLAWNAVRLWRAGARRDEPAQAVAWKTVFVATLLNPKGLIFALAIVPFGSPQVVSYLLAFAIAIILMGFAWLIVGRILGVLAGERRHVVSHVAAAALVAFAGVIAASAIG